MDHNKNYAKNYGKGYDKNDIKINGTTTK